ncbi:MAG: rhomboid family intramembrane serine protease [Bacteroidetes bacterium]|nr:rhomboid family intramembrane serine protease [Bacteroidota bacterium]
MNNTLLLVFSTSAISILAFNLPALKEKLLFRPASMLKGNEWYRFFTSGFIHADWEHLLFNMFSLYLFGVLVERAYLSHNYFSENGTTLFFTLYLSALPLSLLYSFIRYYKKYNYASLGASGAVSAVIFSAILIDPTMKIGLFIIPPIIPGYLFGPLFLILSAWQGKKGRDNVNHAAHISGALYGWVFTIAALYVQHHSFDTINTFKKIMINQLGVN